jgi:hypothetical protein
MGLRPTQSDEERWWRELQLAASALAGGLRTQSSVDECAAKLACSSTECPWALRPTQSDEERWWRELQLAASALAGGLSTQSSVGERVANFGLFFSGAKLPTPSFSNL